MRLMRPTAKPTEVRVPLLGRIEGATNPESAELLPDGETIIFGNNVLVIGIDSYRAGRGITYVRGEAHISRARLLGRGRIDFEAPRLIDGLTGTHGVDVLPVATDKLPVGTLFITEDAGPQTYRGTGIILPKSDYCTCVMAFDPATGEVLGRIPLGVGSAVAKRFRDLEQPNGLAVSSEGDLYVSDMAPGAEVPGFDVPSPSAIYRIPHGAIDGLIAGEPGAADQVQCILTPGKTNGLSFSKADGSLLSVSCSPDDPVGGGIFRLKPADFERERQPAPEVGGLGIIDGVGETKRGTLVVSLPVSGELVLFTTDGRHIVVKDEEGANANSMPADINICYPKILGGEPAVLVPSIGVGSGAGESSVVIVDLSGF